ncbi:hypothetical protein [Porphyromonas crevioricanis]|uniref:Protein BatD n=1 Tax=Porphyromonas crevioricanis TaxID=393921 RepID=A0AB34PF91_9PORP|nr:hypothetical protein [Porphyromonas crevioricanis]KGN94877.1 hypothetical protein HQ38_04960 [Porphyromonas crevioricanis]
MSRTIHCLNRIALSLILIFIVSMGVEAQRLGITAETDRSEMLVGERAAIDLVVRTADISGTRIIIPPDSLQQNFDLLSYQPVDTTELGDGLYELSARMVITAWDSCLLVVPKIRVVCAGEEAEAGPFVIKVNEPSVDISRPDSIADIKAPWQVKLKVGDILTLIIRHSLFYIFLALILLSLLFLLWRRYQKRKALRLPEVSPAYVPTAYEQSKIRLEHLDREAEHYSPKNFYTELLDVLRIYLVEVSDIPAMEMLPKELREAIDASFELETTALADVQTEANLAKYAKGEFAINRMRAAIVPVTDMLDHINTILIEREKAATLPQREKEAEV